MKLKFAIVGCALLALLNSYITTILFQTAPVLAAPAQPKSFFQWCQQKSSVPAATRQTIDILLKKAGTQNCQQADSKLITLNEIDISYNQISDLRPLTALTNLTSLSLSDNQISNLRPLTALTNLTSLSLSNNQISDLRPLAALTNLISLTLSNNQISDLNPLTRLKKIYDLNLSNNKIRDAMPLAKLNYSFILDIKNNPTREFYIDRDR